MYDGTLHFACHLFGFIMPAFSMPGTSASITNIHIHIHDNKLNFSCNIKSKTVAIEESILNECMCTCKKISTNLAFEREVIIGELEYLGGEIINGAEIYRAVSLTLPHLEVAGTMTTIIDENASTTLRDFITRNYELTNIVIILYTKIFNINDIMSKFMMLYHIMLILNDDKQNYVDLCIKKIAPATKLFESPRGSGKSETLYTKLRNEIAHYRKEVDIRSTINQLEDIIPDFTKIVRQAILDSLPN